MTPKVIQVICEMVNISKTRMSGKAQPDGLINVCNGYIQWIPSNSTT